MIHPLLGHLKDSSEEELTKNISKLTQALYSVKNEYLIQQIHIALDDLKECSGINWRIAFKVFAGWIITLVVVGGTSALITAQGIYAPSKNLECEFLNNTIL